MGALDVRWRWWSTKQLCSPKVMDFEFLSKARHPKVSQVAEHMCCFESKALYIKISWLFDQRENTHTGSVEVMRD